MSDASQEPSPPEENGRENEASPRAPGWIDRLNAVPRGRFLSFLVGVVAVLLLGSGIYVKFFRGDRARVASVEAPGAASMRALPDESGKAETAALGGSVVRDTAGRPLLLYEKSHALVIGVSAYDGGWPSLPGVVADVKKASDVLRRHGFEVEVVMDPDRDALDFAFKDFIARHGGGVGQRENRLLFYYAGHGYTLNHAEGFEQVYLVGKSAPDPRVDDAGFRANAVNMEIIEFYAKNIQSKHAIFAFDSCFSGNFFQINRAGVPPGISKKTAAAVRQYVTSGSAGEEVPDKSIFCDSFVAGLEGAADRNRDGYVTGSELGEFLHREVVAKSSGSQNPQYGKSKFKQFSQGDYVFPLANRPTGSVAVVEPKEQSPVAPAILPPHAGGGLAEAKDFVNGAGMDMAWMVPRAFGREWVSMAGRPFSAGEVEISAGYWIGRYEVRQVEYEQVSGFNPSAVKGPNRPVTNITWKDAAAFCQNLTKSERRKGTLPEGYAYRLPWEGEWDRAMALGGVVRVMEAPSSVLAIQGGQRVREVGTGMAEANGLHDLSGNVFEWCRDWHAERLLKQSEWRDPRGAYRGSARVLRGGRGGRQQRVVDCTPNTRSQALGFRVVLAREELSRPGNAPDGRVFHSISQVFSSSEYRSKSPGLRTHVLKEAQTRFAELGLLPTASSGGSGRMDAETQQAINEFQWAKRLSVTGRLDDETLRLVYLDGVSQTAVAAAKSGGSGGSRSARSTNPSRREEEDGLDKTRRTFQTVGEGARMIQAFKGLLGK